MKKLSSGASWECSWATGPSSGVRSNRKCCQSGKPTNPSAKVHSAVVAVNSVMVHLLQKIKQAGGQDPAAHLHRGLIHRLLLRQERERFGHIGILVLRQ